MEKSNFKKKRQQRNPNLMANTTLDFVEKKYPNLPDLKDGDIRILIFGGVEEIGRNMSAIEYKDSIIVIDCGFGFADEDLPGIAHILPNIDYLEKNKKKIKAVFLTHGHLDHIGGIPFCIERMGYPKIYSRPLTNAMVKKRQEEFPNLKTLELENVNQGAVIKVSDDLTVSFFSVTHTIPDSMGVIVETPKGDIVLTGDLKLDHYDGVVTKEEEEEFEVFKKRNVLCCLADSTNSQNPGFSIPEKKVAETLEELIKSVKGRMIIASFASQLERVIAMIDVAEKYNKKVVIEGRSMKTNLNIAKELGLLKVNPSIYITADKIGDYPDDKIMIISTGALGQQLSALWRISRKEHRFIRLQKTDTVILSSSVVPGNEVAVQKMKQLLSKFGVNLITYHVSDVHSSGHANRDELKWIHEHIKSKNFIPIHGFDFMLKAHAQILKDIGLKDENIVIPENGSIIELRNDGKEIVHLKERAPKHLTLVDGNKIGPVRETIINERKVLGKDGMFVFIVNINSTTKRLRRRPDIISRGFIYLKDSQDLLYEIRNTIKKSVESELFKEKNINIDNLKKKVQKDVSSFIFHKTEKMPVVLPVIFLT